MPLETLAHVFSNLFNLQWLILGLTDLTLHPWAPKLNNCKFCNQDYSHILHLYFVAVFCCSPLQERDFVLIVRYKLGYFLRSILLYSPWSLCDQTKRVGEITLVNKILGCFVLLTSVHCKKKLKTLNNKKINRKSVRFVSRKIKKLHISG